jgi:hypothetical protein
MDVNGFINFLTKYQDNIKIVFQSNNNILIILQKDINNKNLKIDFNNSCNTASVSWFIGFVIDVDIPCIHIRDGEHSCHNINYLEIELIRNACTIINEEKILKGL